MSDTNYRGPAISLGAMMGNVSLQNGTQVALIEPTDGPGVEYQANCFPDVRFGPFNKDGLSVGRLPAFLNSPYSVLVDAVPSALATANIVAAANVTSGTAMTLVAAAAAGANAGTCSLVPSTPLIPFGGSSVVLVTGLDMGFATGNTTAGSGSVVVPDSTLFYIGQWVVIGGAGKSDNTLPLIAQVTGSADATHITVSPAPTGTLSNAPISSANAYFSQAGNFPFNVSATAVQPYLAAGVARIFNPAEAVCRNVRITGSASATGGHFIIKGYDVYGVAMSEDINATSGATTTSGKKAFKYIASVTPQFTDAHNYSVGTGDVIGINLRSDKWEYMQVFFNGAFVTANTGWVQALQPPSGPSTTTTADVRGTYALQSASDGSKRLSIQATIPLWNLINATPNNAQSMFGLAQA